MPQLRAWAPTRKRKTEAAVATSTVVLAAVARLLLLLLVLLRWRRPWLGPGTAVQARSGPRPRAASERCCPQPPPSATHATPVTDRGVCRSKGVNCTSIEIQGLDHVSIQRLTVLGPSLMFLRPRQSRANTPASDSSSSDAAAVGKATRASCSGLPGFRRDPCPCNPVAF